MKNKVLSIIVAIALTISVLAITTGSVSAASKPNLSIANVSGRSKDFVEQHGRTEILSLLRRLRLQLTKSRVARLQRGQRHKLYDQLQFPSRKRLEKICQLQINAQSHIGTGVLLSDSRRQNQRKRSSDGQ